MGFFYQALKKAAGVETNPAEELAEGTRLDVVGRTSPRNGAQPDRPEAAPQIESEVSH